MTDPAQPNGTPTPEEESPPKPEKKRVLATVATVLTAIAAALSIFMFFSDTRSLRDYLSRRASEVEEEQPTAQGAARGANSGVAGETTVPISIQAEDDASRTFPLEAQVADARIAESETLVTLALFNRSDETLHYLHQVRSNVRSQNATDRFNLMTSDGEALEMTGQRGLVASPDGAHEVFCLTLPPGGRASMVLEFPTTVPGGAMTLVHTNDPDLVRYRSCGATTIALGDFRLDIPPAP